MRRLLFLVALLGLGAAPPEVAKQDWIRTMRTALPTAFCEPDAYFRQCFKVTAEQCEQTALSATRICLEELKDQVPAILKQPDDGNRWGSKLGECVGNAYEASLTAKRLHSEKCDNPSAWGP